MILYAVFLCFSKLHFSDSESAFLGLYLDDDDDARAGDPWPLRQGGSNQGRGSDALSPLYGSQPD